MFNKLVGGKIGAHKHIAPLLSVLPEELHPAVPEKTGPRRMHALLLASSDALQQTREQQHGKAESMQALRQVHPTRSLHERASLLRPQLQSATATAAGSVPGSE